jgi:hypothetical protein
MRGRAYVESIENAALLKVCICVFISVQNSSIIENKTTKLRYFILNKSLLFKASKSQRHAPIKGSSDLKTKKFKNAHLK